MFGLFMILILITGCSFDGGKKDIKFYAAISGNNLRGVEEELNSGKEIDFADIGSSEPTPFRTSDNRAIAIAIADSDDLIVEALLDAGAEPDSKGDDWTYLTETICNGSYALSEKLIQNGADVNGGAPTAIEEFLSFVYPGFMNAEDKFELLIDNGAIIDEKLMSSCLENEWRYIIAPKVYKFLIEHDKDSGIEAGLVAAINGDDATLQKLVGKGEIQNKKEVLLFAAANCSKETLVLMEKSGYDFLVTDDGGLTPLHVAAMCNEGTVVNYLLAKGISGEQLSESGYKAITYATIAANEDVIRILLNKGYDFQNGDETSGSEDNAEIFTWEEMCKYGSSDSVKTL